MTPPFIFTLELCASISWILEQIICPSSSGVEPIQEAIITSSLAQYAHPIIQLHLHSQPCSSQICCSLPRPNIYWKNQQKPAVFSSCPPFWGSCLDGTAAPHQVELVIRYSRLWPDPRYTHREAACCAHPGWRVRVTTPIRQTKIKTNVGSAIYQLYDHK